MVVVFVSVLDVMQYLQGFFVGCRFHQYLLETTFQCSVLLNGVTVFIECGGTDALYCSACQGRLQDIRCIHASRS